MKNDAWRVTSKILIFGLLFSHFSGVVWAESKFSYAKDNEAVVVHYSRTPAELEALDSSTIVTVYGSGRVVVHYPEFGTRKGDYKTSMSDSELNELVATLIDNNVMEFDPQTIADRAASIQQTQNLVFFIADADVSEFEVNLTQYTPPGGATRQSVTREISISGLQSKYRQFPSDVALKGLAIAERQLIKLIDSDNLTPLP
jgi:hypothetical protein